MIHSKAMKVKKQRKGFSEEPHMGPSSGKVKKGVSDMGWTAFQEGSNKVRQGWLGKAPADPRKSVGKAPKQPSRAL